MPIFCVLVIVAVILLFEVRDMLSPATLMRRKFNLALMIKLNRILRNKVTNKIHYLLKENEYDRDLDRRRSKERDLENNARRTD